MNDEDIFLWVKCLLFVISYFWKKEYILYSVQQKHSWEAYNSLAGQ